MLLQKKNQAWFAYSGGPCLEFRFCLAPWSADVLAGIRLQAETEAHVLERVRSDVQGLRNVPGVGGGGERHPFIRPLSGVHGDLLLEVVPGGEKHLKGGLQV